MLFHIIFSNLQNDLLSNFTRKGEKGDRLLAELLTRPSFRGVDCALGIGWQVGGNHERAIRTFTLSAITSHIAEGMSPFSLHRDARLSL
ncbi:hypothetical protein E6O75_ATG06009 [Venturia nashicola]|uniref:Uncharacterized protein n=1 Tax=Venturia nashicola TaxID=86259 RepID=A0A4Z1NZ18_9PEZI|nr:hypothetical protein E6O75_ATG06009 [Venturia nashicola]